MCHLNNIIKHVYTLGGKNHSIKDYIVDYIIIKIPKCSRGKWSSKCNFHTTTSTLQQCDYNYSKHFVLGLFLPWCVKVFSTQVQRIWSFYILKPPTYWEPHVCWWQWIIKHESVRVKLDSFLLINWETPLTFIITIKNKCLFTKIKSMKKDKCIKLVTFI